MGCDELHSRRLVLARVHRRAKEHGADATSVEAPGLDVRHVQSDTFQSAGAEGPRQVFRDQPRLTVRGGVEHRNFAHAEFPVAPGERRHVYR